MVVVTNAGGLAPGARYLSVRAPACPTRMARAPRSLPQSAGAPSCAGNETVSTGPAFPCRSKPRSRTLCSAYPPTTPTAPSRAGTIAVKDPSPEAALPQPPAASKNWIRYRESARGLQRTAARVLEILKNATPSLMVKSSSCPQDDEVVEDAE